MTTGRINQVAFLRDVDPVRAEARDEEERRSHGARNARSGVDGGSTSSYPLCVPHPRIRARHRGPGPATRDADGVEHDERFLVRLRPRHRSQRRVKRGFSGQRDAVGTGMQHRKPKGR